MINKLLAMKLDTKGIAILAFIVGVVVFLLLSSGGGVKQAPQLSLTTIDGQKIDSQQLAGKPYMMTFWATDCPSCVQEIPHLAQLHNNLQNTGFQLVAVALPHDKVSAIKAMREQKNMPYAIAYDENGEIGQAFGGIRVTPTSYLVSPDGKIVFQKMGTLDVDQLEQQIRDMMKG